MQIASVNNWTQTPESRRDKEKIVVRMKEVKALIESKSKGRYKDLKYVKRCKDILKNLQETKNRFKK